MNWKNAMLIQRMILITYIYALTFASLCNLLQVENSRVSSDKAETANAVQLSKIANTGLNKNVWSIQL